MRKALKWILAVAGAAIVVMLLVVAWAWRSYEAEPAYWRVVDVDEPGLAETAAAFERWVSNAFTEVRDEPNWQIVIEADDVNRWLAARLPKWAANQQDLELPEYLSSPMLALDDGRIIVAAKIEQEDFDKVISLAYRPRVGDDGVVVLKADGLAVGRLWLSVDMAIERFAESSEMSETDRDALAQTMAQWRTIRLDFDLGDGRGTQVTGLDIEPDRLTVTCRTVRHIRD